MRNNETEEVSNPVMEEKNGENPLIMGDSNTLKGKKIKSKDNEINCKFSCTLCNKAFVRKQAYEKHEQSHFPLNKINKSESIIDKIKCKFCASWFNTNSDYLQHIEYVHHKTEGESESHSSYMCSNCGKQYRTNSELNHHIKSKCGTLKRFKCTVCHKNLMSAGSLYNHMLRHKGERSYMCRYCAKLFYTSGQLKVHERIHTQDRAYICHICKKGFCHRQSLVTHSTIHTGIKPYQCENCGNSFSCVGNLIKHRKTHADTCGLVPSTTHRVENPSTRIKVKINTPDYVKLKTLKKREELELEISKLKSELCFQKSDTTSKEKKELEEHPEALLERKAMTEKTEEFCPDEKSTRMKIAETAKKVSQQSSIKCSCCKEVFDTKEECQEHQQKAHSDLLTCSDCDRMFANRDSLRTHSKVFHKGGSRKAYIYICDKCGKQFKQKSYLICHEERKCDSGPFYQCSTCNKQFSSRHTRNNHMRVHDPEKKLLCKFCAKSFHWKGQLKIHERSHTGEKPFSCLYCPKTFAYRESLITHNTIHTGIKPHLCEGCGSRFSCIGNLIKHRSSHEAECGAWTYKSKI